MSAKRRDNRIRIDAADLLEDWVKALREGECSLGEVKRVVDALLTLWDRLPGDTVLEVTGWAAD